MMKIKLLNSLKNSGTRFNIGEQLRVVIFLLICSIKKLITVLKQSVFSINNVYLFISDIQFQHDILS